jgi:hypothetical protein
LRGLESENAKLKKLLADAILDNAALKDLLEKMVTPAGATSSRTLRPSSLMPQTAIAAPRGWSARSRSAVPSMSRIDDPILGQIALGESLVLRPQPLGDVAHRRTGAAGGRSRP